MAKRIVLDTDDTLSCELADAVATYQRSLVAGVTLADAAEALQTAAAKLRYVADSCDAGAGSLDAEFRYRAGLPVADLVKMQTRPKLA